MKILFEKSNKKRPVDTCTLHNAHHTLKMKSVGNVNHDLPNIKTFTNMEHEIKFSREITLIVSTYKLHHYIVLSK